MPDCGGVRLATFRRDSNYPCGGMRGQTGIDLGAEAPSGMDGSEDGGPDSSLTAGDGGVEKTADARFCTPRSPDWDSGPPNNEECTFYMNETCSDGFDYRAGCACFGLGGTCTCGKASISGEYGEGHAVPQSLSDELCTTAYKSGCPMPTEELYKMCDFPQ